MKTIFLICFLILLSIIGNAQSKSVAGISVMIISEQQIAGIGRNGIKNDTNLTLKGVSDFCYDLRIDTASQDDIKTDKTFNENSSLVYCRRIYILNCN